MNRCIIIGGAEINNYEISKEYIKEGDFVIFCDCALKHLKGLWVKPDLVLGDFDSWDKGDLPADEDYELITLPHEKDDTDTMFALRQGIERGFTDFIFLGVLGQRFDHSLSNLSMLLMLDSEGLSGKIIDDYSEIEVVSSREALIPDTFSYFSLISMEGIATGVSISGAAYSHDNFSLSSEFMSNGISNEVLPGQIAHVSVSKGRLLLIKVF